MREIYLLLFLFAIAGCEYLKPKQYKVNLDLAPEERWNEIINDHLQYIPAIKEEIGQYFKAPIRTVLCWLLEKIALAFPEEYAKEMEGISKLSGLNYCEVIGLNILYDITNYNKLIDKAIGCTSIVAEDSSGRILHGRNLDYPMTPLLKNLTVIVDFTKGDKILYTGVSFAYFVGLMTGQKPFAFTVSLNARKNGWYIYTIMMQLYTGFRNPIGLALRQVLENSRTYDEALESLERMHIISPCYVILGGTKSGEGAVITRDRLEPVDVLTLNVKKNHWFIVQTNFDHWDPDQDNRRTTAEIFLNEIKHANVDDETMWSVLEHNPVRNNLTVVISVMSAFTPSVLYRSTVLNEP